MPQPTKRRRSTFADEARRVLSLEIAHPVNALGGYGAGGEVIYHAHPTNCPSVLVDSRAGATATFMSNGSIGYLVKPDVGMEVSVLDTSFDFVEKREIGVPSANVWLALDLGRKRHIASLMNPRTHVLCSADEVRIVKLGDPQRAMWYGAAFRPVRGVAVRTAVRLSLTATDAGPALLREVFLENVGQRPVAGHLWTYFGLHGTQRFVYNKQCWYDAGLPLSLTETIVSARVPYSDLLQIKRVSSRPKNLKPVDATCDYTTFIGDTSAGALLPQAVELGRMLPGGAGRKLNRFTTAAVAAGQFALNLAPGGSATLQQALLYVTDRDLMDAFRAAAESDDPAYHAMAKAFAAAARTLVRSTPSVAAMTRPTSPGKVVDQAPAFRIDLPHQPAVANYANSVWTGVRELYEMCRAHGARLADGIELGTRDRAQDMWPKIKEDPGRVRADLVHALSFMYRTDTEAPRITGRPLTLPEKLHGMFPRQYPSSWRNRAQEVPNDNRPYADSPLWLINALNMYIRETGDLSILRERVKTIALTDPEHPETSSIVGCDVEYAVIEVVMEVLACFERHCADSPYGIAQVLYGDWCDPIDMYGTNPVGDAGTPGRGRGGQIRLAAHLFECLVETVDTLEAPAARRGLEGLSDLPARVERLKAFADRLRQSIARTAWEDGDDDFKPGFIDCVHELKADGRTPDYGAGELGYTLGSMKGTDFDGRRRRVLSSQAYALRMLLTDRDYLTPVPGRDEMVAKVLKTADTLFYREKLGLVLFSEPIANNARAIALAGRMGVVPAGCAENGEYHHGQVMMHRFRLDVPGQADTVWRQFQPIMSAMRDESIAGPFETPCNSYASDPADPHFGKGMYFGLSGSVDWIVEIFHKIVGLRLALHDDRQPDVRVTPNLPAAVDHDLTFRRIIHRARETDGYDHIPLTIRIRKEGTGRHITDRRVTVNGEPRDLAQVDRVAGLDRLVIEIVHVCGA